jgi:DNA-binding NtrC family response regulator
MMAAAGGTILIIDDDAAVSRTLSLILTRAGYQVSVAIGGRKGLELLPRAASTWS